MLKFHYRYRVFNASLEKLDREYVWYAVNLDAAISSMSDPYLIHKFPYMLFIPRLKDHTGG